MSREHFWPQWLIEKTSTKSVRWVAGRINPLSATIPLCVECNSLLGKELESPVCQIFREIDGDFGISDYEAELLVRWLWKFESFYFLLENPRYNYSPHVSFKERVLSRLGSIRGFLALAVSRIHHIDEVYGDEPMGIDSHNEENAIFVSGVFSRIALMVVSREAIHLIPKNFSIHLLDYRVEHSLLHAKTFHPKIGFKDDTEAVGVTKSCSKSLQEYHEAEARESKRLNAEW
jgi:hypothetical protein